MKKIIIFGGTTEGRSLSDKLVDAGIEHVVSVASEYGNEMLDTNEKRHVLVGRMDADAMSSYLRSEDFGKDDICVDATHPYAVEVSENIRRASAAVDTGYIRVTRDTSAADTDMSGVRYVEDIQKSRSILEQAEGNILLTCGAKELHAYCEAADDELKKRTYVRVLPVKESLEACEKEGIEARHIIAVHGPFSCEFNLAIIRQYGIKHLVTKQSGIAGGFDEKIRACHEAGITAYVIKKPEDVDGVSVDEALRMIGRPCVMITLAGCGMGTDSGMTQEVKDALKRADAVFGAKRLINALSHRHKYAMYKAEDIISILNDKQEYKNVVVLFSGDSGFFSGATKAYNEFKDGCPQARIRILPGISSVSYMAALTGESYDDAGIVSIHGHNSPEDIMALVRTIRYSRKTYVLLSGEEDVRKLGRALKDNGTQCKIIIGRDLSYETEELFVLDTQTALGFSSEGVLTALVINDAAEKRMLLPVLKDEDLIRDKVPMTKECIRHEALIRMKLKEGDVVYDIGGGTGSVAIEAAGLHPSLKVYTIEKKAEAAELIEKNIEKLHAGNVTLIRGEAPEALYELIKPDAVFIGGSSGALAGIIEAVHSKGSGIRYVVTAVSLETAEEIRKLTESSNISDAECIQLQVNEIHKAGSHHMFHANNPVMLFSFTY